MKYKFPKDFLWGTATAAAQVEGAAFEDGRGPSIWDVFSRIPGKIKNGDKPDITCDQYHLYEKDIMLMKDMGIKSYRFSFSWSRIIPTGYGEVNQAGIDYYKRLIACLKANGIVPNATMYHWDLPYELAIMGGFGNRNVVKWFTEYANILLENFGGDIDIWVTFNEPIALYVGYAYGFFAPGLKDEKYARQCLHNLLVCHGETVKLFREKKLKSAKVGIVVDVWPHYPQNPGNEADEALVLYNNEIAGYGMFLNPLFLKGYSDELLKHMNENGLLPEILEGDFDTINQRLDFYGLNFYNGLFDNANKSDASENSDKAGGNYQSAPANPIYYHEAIYKVLHMLVEKYNIDIPIYVTENGLFQKNTNNIEELLDDQERIDYIREILTWIHKAMEDGIPVKGYYVWSLLDNYEWTAGFDARYGLHYTDYITLERIPKKSAAWYSDVIKNSGF